MLTHSESTPDRGRHAVVAIILEQSEYLVIRRSEFVRAPGLICFPGGGIEGDEDFESAVRRELVEEIHVQVAHTKHIWTSVTKWGTKLEWLLCQRNPDSIPIPAPEEVSEVLWLPEAKIRSRLDLLGSLPDFFAAKDAGEFQL